MKFYLVMTLWLDDESAELQLQVLELGQHVQQVSTTLYPMSASQIVHNIHIWKILIDE